jgi:hypothetical protein
MTTSAQTVDSRNENVQCGILKRFIRRELSDDGFIFSADMVSIFIIAMFAMGISYILFSVLLNYIHRTSLQSGLSRTATEIVGLFSQASSYANLDNDAAIKAHIVDEKLIKNGSLVSPWGGAITIAPTDSNFAFSIAIDDINEENCVKLAVYQLSNWDSVEVNGSSFSRGSSVPDIIAACGESNTITYTTR